MAGDAMSPADPRHCWVHRIELNAHQGYTEQSGKKQQQPEKTRIVF